jgi:transcriptional regulator with XRE-family HTH domain
MCYYSPGRSLIRRQQRGGFVSALVNFINERMKRLGKNQAQIAAAAGLQPGAISYILTKEAKGGKPVRPEPETIRKLAIGLEVHPSLLTFLMGYPTEPVKDIDDRLYEMAMRLLGAPWLADRIDDFLRLPRSEFDELMKFHDFHHPSPDRNDAASNP